MVSTLAKVSISTPKSSAFLWSILITEPSWTGCHKKFAQVSQVTLTLKEWIASGYRSWRQSSSPGNSSANASAADASAVALNAANAGSAESSVDQMADGNAGKLEGMLEGAVEAVSAPSSAHFDSALVTASAAAAACFAVGGLTVRTCEVHQVQQGWHFEAVVGTLGRGETSAYSTVQKGRDMFQDSRMRGRGWGLSDSSNLQLSIMFHVQK